MTTPAVAVTTIESARAMVSTSPTEAVQNLKAMLTTAPTLVQVYAFHELKNRGAI